MPSLGADMEAGTLVEWLVKPGDRVKRGDIVAVVETQKGAIEVEIFENGVVEQILVDLDKKVPVGTPLAKVRTDAEAKAGMAEAAAPLPAVPPPAAPPAVILPTAAPPSPAAPAPLIVTPPGAPGRVRVSPAARRLAETRGVNLSAIKGSGPGGEVVLTDVEQSLVAVAVPTERKRTVGLDLAAMRIAIAAAMARSKREIPHYYLVHQFAMTAAEKWLARTNAKRTPDKRLLMSALTVKAVALAVRKFPIFNGFYRDGRFEPAANVHVGVAIALRGGGLVAPAIRDTTQLALDDLMARMRDLVQRARAGRIRSSEFSDPTITVSSMGERGVEVLYGVIYPPQVAILGIGQIVERPWVVRGKIAPHPVVTVTLSADHRVSDGHAGALFLAEIDRLLQEPDKL
ncbi:MAG: dihydrolipoamide acetyltransferase family protein [Xanthobacteraceae bacterium]|nr:dihydrolipoamide acetyltransferase family protein [Xanthobacteraceae bacterium]